MGEGNVTGRQFFNAWWTAPCWVTHDNHCTTVTYFEGQLLIYHDLGLEVVPYGTTLSHALRQCLSISLPSGFSFSLSSSHCMRAGE